MRISKTLQHSFLGQILYAWRRFFVLQKKTVACVPPRLKKEWSAKLSAINDVRSGSDRTAVLLAEQNAYHFLLSVLRSHVSSSFIDNCGVTTKSVYSTLVMRALRPVSVPLPFDALLSNRVLTDQLLPGVVRQHWLFLRHNAVYSLSRLSHFLAEIRSDTCPVCHQLRETNEHALRTCSSLPVLWDHLNIFLRSLNVQVHMSADLWCLWLTSLTAAKLSTRCIRAIALLHFYHWRERLRCIKSSKEYRLNSVLTNWNASR